MAWVSSGCGLISTKVRVVGAGRRDGLAEPHRIAHVGHPVLGIENDCAAVVSATVVVMNGIVGVLGVKSASAARNSGRIGSIIG